MVYLVSLNCPISSLSVRGVDDCNVFRLSLKYKLALLVFTMLIKSIYSTVPVVVCFFVCIGVCVDALYVFLYITSLLCSI